MQVFITHISEEYFKTPEKPLPDATYNYVPEDKSRKTRYRYNIFFTKPSETPYPLPNSVTSAENKSKDCPIVTEECFTLTIWRNTIFQNAAAVW